MKKPYEILPSDKGVLPTSGEWTKGASLISRGVPASGASGKQSFGLPYDPAGRVPTYGGATVPGMGKQSKGYEILPPGMVSRGLEKSGGCGGGCGGDSILRGGMRAMGTGSGIGSVDKGVPGGISAPLIRAADKNRILDSLQPVYQGPGDMNPFRGVGVSLLSPFNLPPINWNWVHDRICSGNVYRLRRLERFLRWIEHALETIGSSNGYTDSDPVTGLFVADIQPRYSMMAILNVPLDTVTGLVGGPTYCNIYSQYIDMIEALVSTGYAMYNETLDIYDSELSELRAVASACNSAVDVYYRGNYSEHNALRSRYMRALLSISENLKAQHLGIVAEMVSIRTSSLQERCPPLPKELLMDV